jgi:hypothetical protein
METEPQNTQDETKDESDAQAVDAPNPAEASSVPQGNQPHAEEKQPDERVASNPNPVVGADQPVTEPGRSNPPTDPPDLQGEPQPDPATLPHSEQPDPAAPSGGEASSS